MKLEHLALNLKDPVSAAKWYCENLGFSIIKEMDSSPFHHFIVDSTGSVMLEIFRLPDKKVPNYKATDPAIMHLGFTVPNINKAFEKLQNSGAEVVDEISVIATGDKVAMFRDPWGFPIQIIQRKKKMV